MAAERARGGRPANGRTESPARAHGTLAEPLHRVVLHLLRTLRREDDESGLSPARLSALSVLVFGGPTTLGRLAQAEGVSAPTMSRLVAELEREGWVRGAPDPADARRRRLEASAAARRLLLAGRDRRLGALDAALRRLGATDRSRIARALPALQHLLAALDDPHADGPKAVARAVPRVATARPRTRARRRFD